MLKKDDKMLFNILIRGRNCAKYIGKCINSLMKQTYDMWHGHIILDNPTDDSLKTTLMSINKRKFTVICNKERYGVAYNMYNGIKGIYNCDFVNPSDIIGILDADDWLESNALETVRQKYIDNPGCLITHGSYTKISKGRRTRVSKPYPEECNVRKFAWRASHFKTFNLRLAKYLTKDMFQYDNGIWLGGASDLALMYPLIEIAGFDRVEHVRRLIYNYRDLTPQKLAWSTQKKCAKIVRDKKRQKVIKNI